MGWLADRNQVDGRPMASLLFWFFGGFRCGVCQFIALLVIYKYRKIGKNRCSILDSRRPTVWVMAVLLAVAGDVIDVVLFYIVLFPTRCLGRDLGLGCVSF